jgi:hypothetical protein
MRVLRCPHLLSVVSDLRAPGAIRDAFFEGEGGPEYGEFVLRRNGIPIKGGLCSIWLHGYYGKGDEDFARTKCRSEEEFNELTLKHFGITSPPHRTRTSSQPTTW